MYALVIFGCLWAIARAVGQPFETPYQVVGVLMAGGGFIVLGRYDLLTPWMPGRQGSIGTRMYWAWVVMVGGLLLLGYVTQDSE